MSLHRLATRFSLAILLVAATVPAIAETRASTAAEPVEIDGAVNLIGFDSVMPNTGGNLSFRNNDLIFSGSKSSGSIPFSAIRDVSIEHSNKGLLRGTKGVMASFAPQGIGQVYSLFRPGAETLTIVYVDRHQALHGAVVLLPKDRKAQVVEAFARVGLDPGAMPHIASADAKRGASHHQIPPTNDHEGSTVRVAFPVSQANGLPKAYVAATYEQLIVQLEMGKTLARVWRAGDVRVESGALDLAVTITRAKKGNAGVRGAIPVVGMIAGKTLLEANVRVTNASGVTLLDSSVKGSKRMPGESIAVTQSLAQRVARAVERRRPPTRTPSGNCCGSSAGMSKATPMIGRSP